MKPDIPIYDSRFVYTPSYQTNIRERFAKILAKQVKPSAVVRQIKRKEA